LSSAACYYVAAPASDKEDAAILVYAPNIDLSLPQEAIF
jgi:hypothetical protein